MKEKLKFSQIVFGSFMLFSIYFGAGNMIFPPKMGQLAGVQFWAALAGFIVTDVGLAVLGTIAVVRAGESMDDLAGRVGRRFSLILSVTIYLLIGPLFAMPRTGSVSFELGIVPFLPESANPTMSAVIYTLIFFALTYFLSINPNRIVDIVGKILTPFLLISVGVIFIASLFFPVGEIGAPHGDYQNIAFFKGLVEGYLALDGFAGLMFAITVVSALRNMGLKSKKSLLHYTLVFGIVAGVLMSLVYGSLAFVGAQTSTQELFADGSALLASVTHTLFGKAGNFVIGIAVVLACLTTSIGLTTSLGNYFSKLWPRFSYKSITLVLCVVSFLLANISLSTLIAIVQPILIALYPVVVVLVVLSFFQRFIGERRMIYVLGMAFAFVVSVFDAFASAKIHLGALSDLVAKLPFFELGVGWILPALLGCVIGIFFPPIRHKEKPLPEKASGE